MNLKDASFQDSCLTYADFTDEVAVPEPATSVPVLAVSCLLPVSLRPANSRRECHGLSVDLVRENRHEQI